MSGFASFRFELMDDDGNTRDVVPKNRSLDLEGDRKESRWNWEYNFADKLVFTGADFDWIYARERETVGGDQTRCGGLSLSVYQTCLGEELLRWQFFINLNTCFFDPDGCNVSCKTYPVNSYVCIYRNWENELDVLDLVGTKYNIPGLVGYLERFNCAEEYVTNIDPDDLPVLGVSGLSDPSEEWVLLQTYWATEGINGLYPYTYDGYVLTSWVRERIDNSVSSPPGDGWVSIGGDSWVRKPHIYESQDYFEYFYPPDPPVYLKWKRINRVVGATPEIPELSPYSTTHILDHPDGSDDLIQVNFYKNAMLLDDVLAALLEDACPGTFTIKSNFFRINGDGELTDEPYPTAEAGFDKIMIWQLSEIATPQYSDRATDLKITLKKLLESLRNVFNVDWTIEGTVFRLEHISYFANLEGEDLTFDPYDRYIRKRNKYEYLTVKLPKVELFGFAFPVTPFFNGLPIIYPYGCSDREAPEKSWPAQLVSTDIGYIHQVGENSPIAGMFFGAVIGSGGFTGGYAADYYFAREDDDDGNPRINGHLAYTKLHPNYWKWDRPKTPGNMNGAETPFETTFRSKAQEPILLPVGCEFINAFDPTKLLKTQIGWGEIDKLTISLLNCTLLVRLVH
jgi:hypothetical protein